MRWTCPSVERVQRWVGLTAGRTPNLRRVFTMISSWRWWEYAQVNCQVAGLKSEIDTVIWFVRFGYKVRSIEHSIHPDNDRHCSGGWHRWRGKDTGRTIGSRATDQACDLVAECESHSHCRSPHAPDIETIIKKSNSRNGWSSGRNPRPRATFNMYRLITATFPP